MNHLQVAIKTAGGMKALAASCGVRYQAIQQWLNRGRPPAERVLAIEKATSGKVTRHQLRPDVFGKEPAEETHNRRATDQVENRVA